jgi:hypothetical protein
MIGFDQQTLQFKDFLRWGDEAACLDQAPRFWSVVGGKTKRRNIRTYI